MLLSPLVVAAVFGLIIGSFLNVCIHRLPRGQSLLHPPSTCPRCGRRLRWFD
ncbi:MAG: prepilin peptidase, partial [Vicinamibacteria bacterium]